MALLRLLLLLPLAASGAFAAPFTVRVDEGWRHSGDPVRVVLIEACTSYDCGLNWLAESPPEALRPVVVVASADGTGVVRGTAPAEGAAWWVVVEGGGRMPMALLWRPEVAPGHLSAPPPVEASACRIAVAGGDGSPVAAARVAAYAPAEPDDEDRRPAVIPAWRMWLPPTRTDERGIASIVVPSGEPSELRVAAPGYRSRTSTCLPGSTSAVRLERASAAEVELRDAAGQSLSDSLVRDRAGVPLAVTDAAGRFELDSALLSGRLWFELPGGVVYEGRAREALSGDGGPRLVRGREYSEFRSGRVQLADGAEPGDAIHFWREPRWPWRSTDARAAPPLMRAKELSYALHTLPGEGVWFAADGVGYGFCGFGDAARVSGPGVRQLRGSRPESCPPTVRAAREVEGVVVDGVGAPVADADVWISWGFGYESNEPTVLPSRRFGPEARMLLRSDVTGRFVGGRITRPTRPVFGPLPADPLSSLLVSTERPGYLPLWRQPLERFVSDRGELEVVLRRGVKVTGRAIDARTGDPVAAAQVALGRFDAGAGAVLLRPLASLDPDNGQFGRLRIAQTGASGYFELTARPGGYDLAAQAPGRAFFVRSGLEVGAEGLDVGEIHLAPDRAIVGEVLNQDLVPVSGARILAAGVVDGGTDGVPRTELFRGSQVAAELRSDTLGQFLVTGLNEHSLVDLEVSASGLATERLSAVAPTGAAPLRVVLQPEAVVRGRVTHAGAPVRTWVHLEQSSQATRDRWIGGPTADDGTFRVAGLEAGRYDVVASGAGALEDARTSVQVGAGETVEVGLELGDASGSVAGAVTANGVGLPGVAVRAGRRRTVTDGAGRYAIDRLPRGRVFVSATRQEATRQGEQLTLDEAIDVGSKPRRLDFDFTAFAIRGRVVRSDGSPSPGVKLLFLRNDGGLPPLKSAVAGSDGGFEVELMAGTYDVRATNEPDGEVAEPLRVRGPMSDVEIRVPASLRIEGVVRGLSAKAVSSLQIAARNDELESRSATVDPQGRFTIDGLSSRSWLVIGRVVGTGRRAERRVRITGAEAYVELEFEGLPEVRGTVRLDGAPLEGTPVLLLRGRELAGGRREWTRHDGSFRFLDLPPGDYTLGIGAEMRALSVRADEELVIDLVSGRVEGLAVDPATSQALAGAVVHLWPRAARQAEAEALGGARRSLTDRDGRFAFERVPEGSWTLEVEGLRGSRTRVDVSPGASVILGLP